jgi:hypothetical protein
MTKENMHETQGEGAILNMKEAEDGSLQALGPGDEKTTGRDLLEADTMTEELGYNSALDRHRHTLRFLLEVRD